ncbi:glycosyltransferase [Flavobacterium sp.]|uniref:glycosyltransferase family 2 protein n=1 Tax=Flavobacterium sp. TaxID=239 RepID=UPI00261E8214|nr:glycosyltransferase [Flavobacterium sp.]
MAKISIIIPVYNVEEFLDKCFESIMAQTFKDFEVVVVNDGSKDGSAAICDRWAKDFDQISVIHKENEGVAIARNLGISKSSGDYFYFIDPDDWIEPETLQENYDLALSGDYDMVIFGYQKETVTNAGTQISASKINERKLNDRLQVSDGLVPLLESGARFSIWNKLIKAAVVRDNNIVFPKFKRGQDIAFMLDVFKNTTSLVSNPKIYYHQYAFVSVEKYNPDAVKNHVFFLRQFFNLYEGWMQKKQNYNYFVKLFVLWFFHVIPSSIAANSRLTFGEKQKALKAIFEEAEVTQYLDTFELGKIHNKSIKLSLAILKAKSFLLLYIVTKMKLFMINNLNTSIFRKLYNK